MPETVGFEVDYAEFLEEALVEAWELRGSLEGNVDGGGGGEGGGDGEKREREWWVLKPGMSDKGDGVRLFWSEEGLRGIFEGWEEDEEEDEEEEDDDDDEKDEDEDDPITATTNASHTTPPPPPPPPPPPNPNPPNPIITSHLRHFIAQRYIARPLLLPSLGNRKFHIRSYVLAVGALRVYVFREMLALFARKPYVAPPSGGDGDGHGDEELDLGVHLTNTCLQSDKDKDKDREEEEEEGGSAIVIPFWSLPPPTTTTTTTPTPTTHHPHTPIHTKITHLTSHLFLAAATTQSLNFQTLPNAFEVFGLDWLVDEDAKVWLLECNAFPDFAASGEGEGGKGVVGRFWGAVVGVLVGEGEGEGGVLGGLREGGKGGEVEGMEKVLDVDLGRR